MNKKGENMNKNSVQMERMIVGNEKSKKEEWGKMTFIPLI